MNITKDQIDNYYEGGLETLYNWKMARLREGFDNYEVNQIYKADKREILEEHHDTLRAFARMDAISKRGCYDKSNY